MVQELGGGVGERAAGESGCEIEGEGVCSWSLCVGEESGLRVKRPKTMIERNVDLNLSPGQLDGTKKNW